MPKKIIRPGGLYLNFHSKRLFELLTKRFKIPAGVKCYTVKIPEEILKAPKEILKFALRGIFNADGGVGFDRRNSYKKPYVRINYVSVSQELINQLDIVLNHLKIHHSVHIRKGGYNKSQSEQIQINGERNVKLFIREIGFSNPRHTHKIAYLNS